MKEFEPSSDFVTKVMKDVYAFEEAGNEERSFSGALFSSRLLRYAVSAGGVLLGIANLLRLYFSVFSPVVCR
jgi:hypothetical protein